MTMSTRITIKERPSEVSEIQNFPYRGFPGGVATPGPQHVAAATARSFFSSEGRKAQNKGDFHNKTELITRNLDVLPPLIGRKKVIKRRKYHVPAIRMHKIADPSLGYR